jgi:5-methylcytosine-specific restriction protein B
MITYQDYEKTVYDWLMAKNSLDPSFTFSTRLNGMKGSELDYFIGTEKSGYFGLTFWSIPVGFPGSSADLIDLFFEQKEDGFKFFFEFSQTMSPSDEQNISALNLITNIKEKVREIGVFSYETTEDLKMFKYALGSPKPRYTSLDDLFVDLEIILNALIPLVEKGISKEKEINENFIAQRITSAQFQEIQEKLKKRFSKYEHINEFELNSEVDFELFIKRFKQEDFDNFISFLKEIISRFGLQTNDERLVYNVHNRRGHLSFTVGQRYCFMLSNNEKRGKFGFLSKDKLFEQSEQFEGNHPRPWFTYTNEIQLDKTQKENIFEGIEVELNRSPRSGYRKYNKPEFENFVNNSEFNFVNFRETITSKKPLNQILYGPPGTGKTFKLSKEYFPMYTTKETSLSSEQHFKNVVSECSWWQVVALALLELGASSKVADIMNNRWVLRKSEISDSKNIRAIMWSSLQSHTIQNSETVGVKQRQSPYIFNKKDDSNWEILENEVREQIPELYEMLESVNNFNPSSDKEIQRYVFTTFHQSYSYEDFIEGIKPIMIDGELDGNVAYHIEDGVFKQLCKKAALDPENRYAIFIDEINRGNISSIFGELITLIEQDKRKGATNAMSALLPYSKNQFSVPQNVDIYGTMNTADRSVEALDTALRRRFSFEEMLPKPELLKDKGENGSGKVGEIVLEDLLITINERIEALVDRDHTIGHAFFMEVDSLDSLRNVFANKVIPLLQEYFYGDYAKMEMVIGSDFFNIKDSSKIKFAVKPEDFETTGKTYQIKNLSDKLSIPDEVLLAAFNNMITGAN